MSTLPAQGGVLPVHKPSGPTSHDVVARARRALGIRRIGHTGTLDPFASGLLLLCVGPATRLAEYLSPLPKTYLATVRLGIRTSTDDVEGEVLSRSDAWRELDRKAVEEALTPFRGRIRQLPPAYSAKKVDGVAAHRRARRGEVVELREVEVEVHELELLDFAPPELELRVHCSSGTYVRALARDLGERLGTGAHLTALRRIRIGPVELERAVPLEALEDPAAVGEAWIPPLEALGHLPRVSLQPEDAALLRHGRAVPAPEAGLPRGTPLALEAGGALVAVGSLEGGEIRPKKVFVRG